MKIIISGALGMMGRVIAFQAKGLGIEIAGGVDRLEAPVDFPLYKSFRNAPKMGDVIIDFSRPDMLSDMLDYALRYKIPLVIATTGYNEAQLKQIEEASKSVAIFRSGNFSLGIALIQALSQKAAQVLGEGFDCEIIEAHHNRKVDAPSGTALMLYESVKNGFETPHEAVFGRHGENSKRATNEIGIHAIRGGTIVGEHQVMFLGNSERISISHSAENRNVFASGAIKAAQFMKDQKPGMYNMQDVVGHLI